MKRHALEKWARHVSNVVMGTVAEPVVFLVVVSKRLRCLEGVQHTELPQDGFGRLWVKYFICH